MTFNRRIVNSCVGIKTVSVLHAAMSVYCHYMSCSALRAFNKTMLLERKT